MIKSIIDKIENERDISKAELELIINTNMTGENGGISEYLKKSARRVTDKIYGKNIYIRGLIEFTNFCKNNCYYCGIRRDNYNVQRYRLSKEQILQCCDIGYELGFRTFVLQGGEDLYYTDAIICDVVSSIKDKYKDCAVTLSIGEKSKEVYKEYFNAGADRYLLRHETANTNHYKMLHPRELSLENRKRCLYDLKEIGYQVGCGFMVGSPYQTTDTLYDDLKFIKELEPHMVGIGPFIPQKDTPFSDRNKGTLDMTLKLLSIIRLMNPNVLLPATTALGSIHPLGRQWGIEHGANVIMPNLSPQDVRDKYALYDNKAASGLEAAEHKAELEKGMKNIGYDVVVSKGDYKI